LIELLIFSAIFSVTMIVFIAVLVAVTRVQVRESTAAEVNQQSQFLLQTIERYVEQSSAIEMAKDTPGDTLKLRMASLAEDPIYIYLSSGAAYLRQTDAGTPQALTSPRVTVSSLTFTKHENAGGHHSVSVSFAVAYNSPNPQQQFSQALQTAITRVNAATFDSNILPGGSNLKLGVAPGDWQSINDTIYFNGTNVGIGTTAPDEKLTVQSTIAFKDGSGATKGYVGLAGIDGSAPAGSLRVRGENGILFSVLGSPKAIIDSAGNVGIGVSNPSQTLEVKGGLRLNTSSGQPTCDATQRGTMWVTESGGGTKDKLEVCVKNASDGYIWYSIY